VSATAAAGPGDSAGALIGRFERLTLPTQSLSLGLCAGLLMLLLRTSLEQADAGSLALPADAWQTLWAWPLALWLLPLLLAFWPLWRASAALRRVQAAARQFSSEEEPPDHVQVPHEGGCDELHRLTLSLRRAVDQARRRRQALLAMNAALGLKLQSRTQELSSLQDLSISLAAQPSDQGLVAQALAALESALKFSSASVWARQNLDRSQPVVLAGYRSDAADLAGIELGDLTGLRLSRSNLQRYEQIERDGQPLIENQPRQGLLAWLWELVTDDARTSALYRNTRAWMAAPLKVNNEVFGVLRVDHDSDDFFDAERSRLLSAVAGQTALAMSHAHALKLQREAAVVAERNRIARELHDAVSQTLFAANLLAGALAQASGVDPDTREQARVLERLNRSALAEMRMMLFELRPDALESVRLPELLQQVVEALSGRGGVHIDTQIEERHPVPATVRVGVYRIAQSALSNIGRHSGAGQVRMQWQVLQAGKGRLHISDDGCGFDLNAETPGHFGVAHMRERAASLGAELQLRSEPGTGTEVLLELSWTRA